jgi:hypothetical protein
MVAGRQDQTEVSKKQAINLKTSVGHEKNENDTKKQGVTDSLDFTIWAIHGASVSH